MAGAVAELPLGSREVQAWWQANLATPEATAHALNQFDTAALVAYSRLAGGALLHRGLIFLFTLAALFLVLKDQDSMVAQLRVAGSRLLGATGERAAQQIILSVRGTINGLVLGRHRREPAVGRGARVLGRAATPDGHGPPHPLRGVPLPG